MTQKHTPGPWKHIRGRLRPRFSTTINEIQDSQGNPIVNWQGFDDSNRPKGVHAANARFIVRACNAHEDLLAALERLMSLEYHCDYAEEPAPEICPAAIKGNEHFLGGPCHWCEARTAIAKARAGP